MISFIANTYPLCSLYMDPNWLPYSTDCVPWQILENTVGTQYSVVLIWWKEYHVGQRRSKDFQVVLNWTKHFQGLQSSTKLRFETLSLCCCRRTSCDRPPVLANHQERSPFSRGRSFRRLLLATNDLSCELSRWHFSGMCGQYHLSWERFGNWQKSGHESIGSEVRGE